ncbi:MAG: GAF domain-containing protein [Anaerolineae bacterium]|nr:GAF domain-containing protein [Anaerolineae bacterium]
MENETWRDVSFRVFRYLTGGAELEAVLQEILTAGLKDSEADRAAVYLYDWERDRLSIGCALGLSEEYLAFLTSVFRDVPGRRILETSEPVWVRDAWNDPEARALWEAARREGFRSYVVLPLIYHGQVLGAMVFYYNDLRDPNPDLHRFYQALADQAAIAVANSILLRSLRRRAEALAALREIDAQIAVGADLETVLETIAGTIQKMLRVSTYFIGLYDPLQEEIHFPVFVDRGERQPPVRLKVSGSEAEGLSAWVIRTGEPVWVRDFPAEKETLPVQPIQIGGLTRSIAMFPLKIQQRVLGVLSVQSYEPHAFTEDDRQLLEEIAIQTAIALENARLLRESRSRATQLMTAARVARAAASILDVDQLLSESVELIREQFGFYYVGIFLLDEKGKWAILRAGTGEAGRKMLEIGHKLEVGGRSMIGWCTAYGKARIALDVGREAVRFDNPLLPLTRSEMALPLKSRERVIGAMTVQSDRPAAFTSDDIVVLQTVADQLATAIENARLYQEVRHRQAQSWVLREVMLAAASTLDFDQVLQRAIQTLRTALNVEFIATIFPDKEDPRSLRIHPSQLGYEIPVGGMRIPRDQSVAGWVMKTGEPMLIRDVRKVPFYYPGHPDVQSELCVPIRIGGEVIGVLNVESRRLNAFNEDDLTFYTAIAGQLGVALENARLYQQEQRLRRKAESLYRAAQAMTTSLDLQKVLEHILTELELVVPYDSASVQLLEEGVLKIIAGRGFPNPQEIIGARIHPESPGNPNGRVLNLRVPVILEDAPALYEEFRRPPHVAAGTRAWMGIPLLYGDRVIGMLTLDKRQPGFYNAEHARIAMAFAGQAAIAIENARIYQQLEERSTELAKALRKLQDLDRLREQVIQNVSHELRTPLTLIQGYAELLLKEDLGPLQPAQRTAMEVIFERVQTLGRIIGNLTAFRSLQAEALVIAPISLPELVEWVRSHYHYQASRSGIELIVEVPPDLPKALADREHLALALSQLVENAIKFSPGGGRVWIRAWSDESWVYLAVEDEGVGIPPEHLDRIFERFYQVDGSTTRRFGGLGIGLALVWEIMEAHRGHVSVESQVGKGSKFVLSLRRAE